MNRVTYWNDEYGCWSYHCSSGDAAKLLAAYEDTGLEPEEIKELCSDDVAKVAKMFRHIIEDGSIDRLEELLQADQDGRLIVLPCKVGDTVFDIKDGTPYETRVLSFSYFGDGLWACRTVSSYPNLNEFGKRIFLTREEAEAALAEKGEENEN